MILKRSWPADLEKTGSRRNTAAADPEEILRPLSPNIVCLPFGSAYEIKAMFEKCG
jgi:hypothetical protein